MKNKNILYILAISVLGVFHTSAQVGINTNTVGSSVALQIEPNITTKAMGFNFPEVALVSSTSGAPFTSPNEGMAIFNTTTNIVIDGDGNTVEDLIPGHYYWNGTQWVVITKVKEQFIIRQTIDKNILGYDPTGSYSSVSSNNAFLYDDTNNANTVDFVKERCVQWIEDDVSKLPGYGYCAITINSITENGVTYPNASFNNTIGGPNGITGSSGITWKQAFQIAKKLGGYLVTIPQATEWDFVLDNVIKPGTKSVDPSDTSVVLNNNIWMGLNRIIVPGKTAAYKWITGEVWSTNWETSKSTGATVQNNFGDNEPSTKPSNTTTTESCVHIWNTATNAKREWNDGYCIFRSDPTYGKTNQMIVKFLK